MSFIQYLVSKGVASHDDVSRIRRSRQSYSNSLSISLVHQNLITAKQLVMEMSDFYNLSAVDLEDCDLQPESLDALDFQFARRHTVFPVRMEPDVLWLAMADPYDLQSIEAAKCASSRQIKPMLARLDQVEAFIEKHYNARYDHEKKLARAVTDAKKEYDTKKQHDPQPAAFEKVACASDSAIAKTVDSILSHAAQSGASDIHIEPQEKEIALRYRLNGALQNIRTLPSSLLPSLSARIKILAGMDIAEQRRPQDGRIRTKFAGDTIDIRVSSIRTFFGEKIVMRLLNQSRLAVNDLESIGFGPSEFQIYFNASTARQGIVLVTGATGSGKTTTLYATLHSISNPKLNITTIEDPIEYLLPGISQTQVNPKIGVNFASSLRTILRQDPDVILVGEIRDRETADIAFKSALTGHLVFSTLHTNGAISSITRLYDIGLEPYLIASALNCVVSQRLVRRICPNCKVIHHPGEDAYNLARYFFADSIEPVFYRGQGCEECNHTGFKGRAAIFEVLPIDDDIRAAISKRVSEQALFRLARSKGFRPFIESCLDRVADGTTTLEEVFSVVDAKINCGETTQTIENSPAKAEDQPVLYLEYSLDSMTPLKHGL